MVDMAAKYKKLSIKRSTIHIDIWFLQNCIKEQVTPNFAKVKTSRNINNSMKRDIELKIIRQSICKHYAKLNLINCELKNVYDQLVVQVDFLNLQNFLTEVNYEVNSAKNIKFDIVNKKLKVLLKEKLDHWKNKQKNLHKFSEFKFHDRVMNLSGISFDDDEMDLLKLGLKFALESPVYEKNLLEFAVEVDVAIEQLSKDTNVKKIIRNDVHNFLYKVKRKKQILKSNLHNHFKSSLNKIKDKCKDNNLIFSKADKGNCLVILKKSEYIDKVESFLSEHNFKSLSSNPMNTFIRKMNTIIKVHKQFFEEFSAPFSLISSNPVIPRLYGLPKIHKLDIPIRPVVSFTNTPVSSLASFIYKLIKNLSNFKALFSVNNTLDLIEKLKNLNLPSDICMVSFDVSNLFTSVPKSETVPLVGEILRTAGIQANHISYILTILNFCLSQDFFVFNNKYYQQPDGLAMGSCLSPLLAEIFMNNLENKFIVNNSNPEILYWYRYVDDCLAFIKGNVHTTQNLLNKINLIHPNIKFTLENEVDNRLNFLDITIHRTIKNLQFSIYRKQTQTDHVIPSFSSHPQQHKMASFYCYIHRLLNVPLSISDYNIELNILKQIAVNNNYNPNLINNLIQKIKSKKELHLAFPKINTIDKFISLPFINDKIANNITKCFKNNLENVKISFKTSSNLSRHLVNTKDKVDKLFKSGIYRLNCSDCDAAYIGRTCRPLSVRINEHLNPNKNSAFGHHLRFNNHNFSPNRNSQILIEVHSKNYNRLDFLEDIHIDYEMLNNVLCLNTQVNLNRSYIPLHRRLK